VPGFLAEAAKGAIAHRIAAVFRHRRGDRPRHHVVCAVAQRHVRPIGVGDGITFRADLDDSGRPLDGRCDVTVRGTTPSARYFTLTLYSPSGNLIANSLSRFGFTSQELVRDRRGDFEVTVSPRARPGNWLPTGGVERYILVMRFYDTSLGIATRAGREAPMPAIVSSGKCA
jgi:hypothetical protein